MKTQIRKTFAAIGNFFKTLTVKKALGLLFLAGTAYVIVAYGFGAPHIISMKDTDNDVKFAELYDGALKQEVAIATNRSAQELYANGVGRVMTDHDWILIDRDTAPLIKAGTVIRLVDRQAVNGTRTWGYIDGTNPEWCRWNDLHKHEPWICSGLKGGVTWNKGDAH